MTISTISGTTGPIPGNGLSNTFSFSFSVESEDEIQVLYTASGGGTVELNRGSYEIGLVDGGRGGGFVTYPVGSGRLGETEFLTIRLNPDFDQPVRLIDQGDYNPSQIERGLDHLARQTKALKIDAEGAVRSTAGQTVEIGRLVAGQRLRADLLSSGTYAIVSGEPTADNSSALRILYADDLGLRADGTDETATINAKMLELSEAGQAAAIYLKSPVGYWTISSQLKVRSGIGLAFGSPIRATRDGQLGFVGNYERKGQAASVTSAVAVNATTIPITVTSGSPSGVHPVGDQVELASGQIVRVTGVDDVASTLTVTPAVTTALAAGSSLRALVFSYCVNSWTRHDTPNELLLEDASRFATGDIVEIRDDETTEASDGSGPATINTEYRRIKGIVGNTVQFDASVKHWMTTANKARVIKVNPCRNATLQGASVEFIEPPDADRVNTFQSSLAWKCQYLNCSVPNEDAYGTRGRAFELSRCFECEVIDCWSGPSKYTGSGEGYGLAFVRSTNCHATRFMSIGNRHGVSFVASTDCSVRDLRGAGWTNNLVDFHGQREIGCWVYGVEGVGNGLGSQTGIAFGNPTWRGGTYECGVEGGEITDLQGTGSRGIVVWAPADDCDGLGVVFRRCLRGFDIRDQVGDGTIAIGEIRIACEFLRCDRAGLVQMNANGSSSRPFGRLDLSGSKFIDFADGLYITDVLDLVARYVLLRTSRPTTNGYAFEVQRATGAVLRDVTYHGCQKHNRLVDTPARLIDCEVRSPGLTTWIDENSASPVSGDVIDMGLVHPAGWSPGRVSDQSNLLVYSRPGMT